MLQSNRKDSPAPAFSSWPARSAGNNYSACFSFEWRATTKGANGRGPTFPTFNLYYLCFLLSALAGDPALHLRSPGFISSSLSVRLSVDWSAGRLVGWSTPPRPPFQLTQDYGHVLAAAVVVIQPLNCVLAFVAFSTAFLWLLQLRFSSWVSNNIIGIEGFSQPAQRPSSLNLG